MKREHWIGVIVGFLGLLAALGFSSPGTQIKELKAGQADHEKRIAAHDVTLGKMDQKLDDLTAGMTEILGHRPRGH